MAILSSCKNLRRTVRRRLNRCRYLRSRSRDLRYFYRGEQYDSDLGLYYLRARYYNPTNGRFLNVDPQASEGQRRYQYAAADPVNGMDPTGNEALTEFLLLQFRPLPIMSWPKWCLTARTNPMSGDLPACGTPGGPPPPPDPCPGYICKPSYEITVSFWPLGAKGFGHVGVAVGFGQVNDNTQGWATVQHWVMWGPVQMGVPVPGILKDDLATYPGKPHSYLHIPVPDFPRASLIRRIARFQHDAGFLI